MVAERVVAVPVVAVPVVAAPTSSRSSAITAPMPPEVSSACTGTTRSMIWASTGPLMIRVGTATIRPKISVVPRSAFNRSMAVTGPGCGGIRPCRIDRPASAGMPIFISDTPVRRPTSTMIGTRITTPISKNIGSPMIAAISAIAQGSVFGPTRSTIRSTISLAPPESASSFPSIAPRAISRPTLPKVLPRPSVKLVTTSSGATAATTPSTAVPRISAMNGWNFAQTISTTTAAMPSSAAAMSWPLPALLSGWSAAAGIPR